ncbi:hypothetical protein [Streptomyces sp. NPDC090026]|uniref:hypothetical protein n=1 Tax=Streptomyces sp. NPDC090026 TaxID=3365923 RepID=UPI00382621DC
MTRRLLTAAGRAGLAHRLADGSRTLYHRRATALTAWIAAGRRDDLTGWRAALGPLLRIALLTGAAALAYRALRAVPWLAWIATATWLTAAWRASTPTQTPHEQPADEPVEAPAAPSRDAVIALLRAVLRGRPAVHLSEVLAHLHQRGQGEGWTVADLRARLESLGIPVVPKVKVGGIPTRGVRATDLDALSPPRETAPSPTRVDAA